MAGHSKWANIRRKKERADKRKGKEFTRLAKEIISAVKQGGPDPKTNQRLRLVVQRAKSANFPNENIERNIQKANNPNQGDFSEVLYELYGYGGVGIIVEVITDNKNRSASDIRIAINKCGGTIATPGSVSYNFERKGIIQIAKKQVLEEDLFTLATEKGAEDFDELEDRYILITPPEKFSDVRQALEINRIPVEDASLDLIPKILVECSQEEEQSNMKLIEWLENLEDVDAVYHNMIKK